MKKIIITVFALAALCCCTKENETPLAEENGNPGQEITAPEAASTTIVCNAPQAPATHTATSGSTDPISVIWLDGDAVKVYGENFTGGVTYTAAVAGSASATFTAPDGVTDGTRYAVYPASAAGSMTAGKIAVDLSAFRSYDYHSTIPYFGDAANYTSTDPGKTDKQFYEEESIFPHMPLFASSTDENFTFSNLYGGLKLMLNDYQGNGMKIMSVKVTADKYISGTMNIAQDGTFTLSGSSEDEKTITVISDTGVKISPANYATTSPNLTRNDYGKFYCFLPAGTYTSLSFEFTDDSGRKYTKTTSKSVSVTPGVVNPMAVLQFTLYYGTTNCYQTTPGNTVDIDITPYYTFDGRLRRNGSAVEGTVPSLTAAVLWELAQDGTALVPGSVISGTPSIAGNTMSVTVGAKPGNAVVAVKNGDDIMWSWHIWVTDVNPSDLQYKIGGDSFYMMDRDLGAVWAPTISTKAANKAYLTYGMMYQWGRKDPLPTYGVSDINTPSTVLFDQLVDLRAHVKSALNHPLERIVSVSGTTNSYVYPTSKTNYLFWGYPSDYTAPTEAAQLPAEKNASCVKTVYDPCPEGYMVPQSYHFSGLHSVGTIAGDGGGNYNIRNGYVDWFIFNDAVAGSASASDVTFFNLRGALGAAKTAASGDNTQITDYGTYSNLWTSTPFGSGWGGTVFQPKFSKKDGSTKAWIDFGGLSATTTNSVRCLKQ